MSECKHQIEVKRSEIVKLQDEEKTIATSFQTSLGENNKFEEFLTKVFKRKIKRVKKKEARGSEGELHIKGIIHQKKKFLSSFIILMLF